MAFVDLVQQFSSFTMLALSIFFSPHEKNIIQADYINMRDGYVENYIIKRTDKTYSVYEAQNSKKVLFSIIKHDKYSYKFMRNKKLFKAIDLSSIKKKYISFKQNRTQNLSINGEYLRLFANNNSLFILARKSSMAFVIKGNFTKLEYNKEALKNKNLSKNNIEFRFAEDKNKKGLEKKILNKKTIYLHKEILLSKKHILYAAVANDMHTNMPTINIKFNKEGAKILKKITQKRGKKIAIIYNNKVLTAPAIHSQITDGSVIIVGNLSKQEARRIVDSINN